MRHRILDTNQYYESLDCKMNIFSLFDQWSEIKKHTKKLWDKKLKKLTVRFQQAATRKKLKMFQELPGCPKNCLPRIKISRRTYARINTFFLLKHRVFRFLRYFNKSFDLFHCNTDLLPKALRCSNFLLELIIIVRIIFCILLFMFYNYSNFELVLYL